MSDDAITPGDVEGAREAVLESLPDDASQEARDLAIDAVLEMDERLTDPEFYRDGDGRPSLREAGNNRPFAPE